MIKFQPLDISLHKSVCSVHRQLQPTKLKVINYTKFSHTLQCLHQGITKYLHHRQIDRQPVDTLAPPTSDVPRQHPPKEYNNNLLASTRRANIRAGKHREFKDNLMHMQCNYCVHTAVKSQGLAGNWRTVVSNPKVTQDFKTPKFYSICNRLAVV